MNPTLLGCSAQKQPILVHRTSSGLFDGTGSRPDGLLDHPVVSRGKVSTGLAKGPTIQAQTSDHPSEKDTGSADGRQAVGGGLKLRRWFCDKMHSEGIEIKRSDS